MRRPNRPIRCDGGEGIDDAIDRLRGYLRDDIRIVDNGRRLVGPADTELVSMHAQQSAVTAHIDRRSRWGNPFELTEDGGDYTREQSVELYKGYFLGKVEQEELDPETLRGETLGCWCLPRLCHGCYILNYLANTYEEPTGDHDLGTYV